MESTKRSTRSAGPTRATGAAPHAVLGIPPAATARQARAAFRRLALIHHPDRNPGDAKAHERFKRILRAYRAFLAGAGPGREPAPAPRGPRPDRYACARCGDSFPFPEVCPRCGVALLDRSAGPVVGVEDPRVRELIERLEARPRTPSDWETRVPVPALLVAACLCAAAVVWRVGPVGVALLFAGFAAYVTGVELHRRLSLAIE
jgi:hypothetical protein